MPQKKTQKCQAFAEIFGESLQWATGEKVVPTDKVLKGKIAVGVYFAEAVCGLCTSFTSKLTTVYDESLCDKGFEVVLVSLDESEEVFDAHAGKQPWLALPYSQEERQRALRKRYRIDVLPALIILDDEGHIITVNGRSKVARDPKGGRFPWIVPRYPAAVGDELWRGDDAEGREAILGKTVGLYFATRSCAACQALTPALVARYRECRRLGFSFEVVFVSSDAEEGEFEEHFKSMETMGADGQPESWLAIPFSEEDRRENLREFFAVEGVPRLVIIDSNFHVLNTDARNLVAEDNTCKRFPWAVPLIGDLTKPEGLGEEPGLCVFVESLGPEQQDMIVGEAQKFMDRQAKRKDVYGQPEPRLPIFFARSSSGQAPLLRSLCGFPDAEPLVDSSMPRRERPPPPIPRMAILDLADGGALYLPRSGEVTMHTMDGFCNDFRHKTLDRRQLSPGDVQFVDGP